MSGDRRPRVERGRRGSGARDGGPSRGPAPLSAAGLALGARAAAEDELDRAGHALAGVSRRRVVAAEAVRRWGGDRLGRGGGGRRPSGLGRRLERVGLGGLGRRRKPVVARVARDRTFVHRVTLGAAHGRAPADPLAVTALDFVVPPRRRVLAGRRGRRIGRRLDGGARHNGVADLRVVRGRLEGRLDGRLGRVRGERGGLRGVRAWLGRGLRGRRRRRRAGRRDDGLPRSGDLDIGAARVYFVIQIRVPTKR
mmetsp:Transcript_2737/g.8065  ORF Transcript_2737/g.8065 Transcript_2737/m.8065 type:complete len:253 (+) Transcript_2737:76-834(+)